MQIFIVILVQEIFSISSKCGYGTLELTKYETFTESQYEGCIGYTNLILNEGITTIPARAFYGCTGFIGKLTLPLSIESIKKEAFYGCSGFSGSLEFKLNVYEIDEYAFYGCSGFDGSLDFKHKVQYIKEYAFYGCSGLTESLSLPNNLREVGDYAFTGCSGITKIYFNTYLQKIGKYAFANCTGLNSDLSLNTIIDEGAFYGCSRIPKVTFNSGVPNISSYSFYGCTGLLKIDLSNNINEIGEYSFYGCKGLNDTLVLPSKIEKIGKFAFGETNFDFVKITSKNPNSIQCTDNIFSDNVQVSISNFDGKTFCGATIPEKTPIETPAETLMATPSKSPIAPYNPNSNKNKSKNKVDLPTIIIPCCIGGVALIAIIVFLSIHYRDRCCGDNSSDEYDPRVIEDLSNNPKSSRYERPLDETQNPRIIGDIAF